MAETHVASALKEKRIKLASEIERLREEMRRRIIDLDHCEAAASSGRCCASLGRASGKAALQ